MPSITPYPVESAGGPFINRIFAQPKQFTVTHYEFDDGGMDVNVQPCGLKRWILEYDALSLSERDTIEDHFNDAREREASFAFANPQDDTTYTTCFYESLEYGTHAKSWVLPVRVTLVSFL